MPSLFNQLVSDPVAFGNERPIEIDDSRLGTRYQANNYMVPKGHVNILKGSKKIPRMYRICYLKFDLYKEYRVFELHHTKPSGSSELCYWLPWEPNNIIQTYLDAGGNGKTAPRIFLTAALDGCSVFVERYRSSTDNRKRTVVYHANAGFFRESEIVTGRYGKNNHEIMRWKAAVIKADVGRVRKGVNNEMASISSNQYYFHPDIFNEVGMAQRAWQVATKDPEITYSKGYFLPYSSYIKNAKIDTGAGKVFGVWKNDRWDLYVQSVVRVKYQRRLGVKANYQTVEAARVLKCHKIG